MTQHKFELRPSMICRAVIIFLFLGGACCLVATGFVWWLMAIVACFYSIGFYYIWQHHALMRGKKTIISFWRSHHRSNSWHLLVRDDIEYFAELLPSSVVAPFLMILHFSATHIHGREADGKAKFISVVIFKDMLFAKDFRHLFVDIVTGKYS